MRKNLSALFILIAIFVQAQSGTIVTGVVSEKGTNGELPIPYANVLIKGLDNSGAYTEADGSFELSLEPGVYKFVVSYLGYKTKEIEIEIKDSKSPIQIELEQESTVLSAAIVTARRNKTSEVSLLKDRANAVEMVQNIGANKLSNVGASNAADGLVKITGISKSSGSNSGSLFVRGLGDRYNNVTLNGFYIPSSSPDTKTPSLDIFSTSLISYMEVSKIYSSKFYGDFAGANISIVSSASSSIDKTKISLGTTVNTQVTFKDYNTYKGGSLDFIGIDNVRKVEKSDLNPNLRGEIIYDNQNSYGKLNNNFQIESQKADPEISFSFLINKNIEISEENKLSVKWYADFKNDYSKKDYYTNYFNEEGIALTNFSGTISKYKTQKTSLLSLYYKFLPKWETEVTSLIVQNSSDDVRDLKGTQNPEYFDLRKQLFTYEQNTIWVNQMKNKITLDEDSKIDIGLSYNYSQSDMPDRKIINLIKREGEPLNFNNIGGDIAIKRYFSTAIENSINPYINFNTVIFEDIKLDLGYSMLYKRKKIDFFFMQYNNTNGFNNISETINNTYTDEQLYDNVNLWLQDSQKFNDKIAIMANTVSGQDILFYNNAGNLNLSIDIEDFSFSEGLRLDQIYLYNEFELNQVLKHTEIDTIMINPFINTSYKFSDDVKLRLAFSKTYSLPQFRELNYIRFDSEIGSIIGNPSLHESSIYNYDLGIDWYYTKGKFIALNLFYKKINSPIEKIQIAKGGGSPQISLVNSDYAETFGIEFEGSVEATENLELSSNLSILESKSVISESTRGYNDVSIVIPESELTHQLQGSASLLFNLDATYNIKEINGTAALSYNYTGEVLDQIGAYVSSVYLKPLNTLNFKYKQDLFEDWNLSFSIKNILNKKYEYYQTINGKESIVNQFTNGVNIGVTLGYNF